MLQNAQHADGEEHSREPPLNSDFPPDGHTGATVVAFPVQFGRQFFFIFFYWIIIYFFAAAPDSQFPMHFSRDFGLRFRQRGMFTVRVCELWLDASSFTLRGLKDARASLEAFHRYLVAFNKKKKKKRYTWSLPREWSQTVHGWKGVHIREAKQTSQRLSDEVWTCWSLVSFTDCIAGIVLFFIIIFLLQKRTVGDLCWTRARNVHEITGWKSTARTLGTGSP